MFRFDGGRDTFSIPALIAARQPNSAGRQVGRRTTPQPEAVRTAGRPESGVEGNA
jgi:hypothetical protein